MRKNKPHRIIKRQKFLFVLQNQVICRLIITDIRAAFQTGIGFTPLFVYAEISGMCGVNVNAAQILFIRSIKQRQIFIQNGNVFLFKHLTIFRIDLVSVGVILPVFFNFIDEEQRQSLDASLI